MEAEDGAAEVIALVLEDVELSCDICRVIL